MDVPELKSRSEDAHKGVFGRTLIIAGSRGMSGAACLSASAACRAGAGLVTVAVPDRCLESVASYDPNYMTLGIACDDLGRFAPAAEGEIRRFAKNVSSIGIGPGMTTCDGVTRVVTALYQHFPGPMVVDADALNTIAEHAESLAVHEGPRILTPHIGEFRRLTGDNLTVEECRDQSMTFAKEHNLVLVLKGHRTIVTDGESRFINKTGNPGMATGGSGDVLTGVITALAGQGYAPLSAAALGVHVHGLAGDLAAEKFGQYSLVAENIKDTLCKAFQRLSE